MQTRPITGVSRALASAMKLAALIVCGAVLGFPQTKNKTLEWGEHPLRKHERAGKGTQLVQRIEDIEIEDFIVAGKAITIGQTFAANDDWLKDLVVRVKNISNRQVPLIQISLTLPELERNTPYVIYCYGCAAGEKEKGVAPGETVELRMMGGSFYDWVKGRAAEKGGISRISKAHIDNFIVHLVDGMSVMSGCMKTSGPTNACPNQDIP